MSHEELKYPKWQREFQEAVVEPNCEKLFERIQEFETVIFVRLQELATSNDHHEERQAMHNAISTIRILKKEKLSLPD